MRKCSVFASLGGAAAIALGVAGAASASTVITPLPAGEDSLYVHTAHGTLYWQIPDETQETYNSPGDGSAMTAPKGFTSGTVWLTEAGTDGGISDGFTINTFLENGVAKLAVFFISDGASSAAVANFPVSTNVLYLPETGNWQDVSGLFGQAPGFAQIASDVGVPEPATWAMMILGFFGLGAALRSRRSPALA
jgi:hypothetical protein